MIGANPLNAPSQWPMKSSRMDEIEAVGVLPNEIGSLASSMVGDWSDVCCALDRFILHFGRDGGESGSLCHLLPNCFVFPFRVDPGVASGCTRKFGL
jgi:hypothetical protein